MTSKQVSWSQSGHEITVEVTSSQFILTMDSNYRIQTGMIERPAATQRAMHAQRGAYGNIGKVIIYNERAQELMAIQAEQKAELKVEVVQIAPLLKLEAAVEHAEQAVQAHHENPAYAYHELEQAQASLEAWKVAHPDLWKKEVTFKKQIAADARYAAGTGEGRD